MLKEKITKEQTIKLHRELWNNMAEIILNSYSDLELIIEEEAFPLPENSYALELNAIKRQALNKMGYSILTTGFPYSRCFLCEYANQNQLGCDKCPLNWGYGNGEDYGEDEALPCYNSYYGILTAEPECVDEDIKKEVKKKCEDAYDLVKLIRDLPLKEDCDV